MPQESVQGDGRRGADDGATARFGSAAGCMVTRPTQPSSAHPPTLQGKNKPSRRRGKKQANIIEERKPAIKVRKCAAAGGVGCCWFCWCCWGCC